jgi:GTP-binding protein Era
LKKCGYITLLGKPNAGKSTLLNASVGFKLAGVSKKPQTTRNRIRGICNIEDAQLIFIDTPGLHQTRGKTKLNSIMNQAAWSSLNEADVVCYLLDCTLDLSEQDEAIILRILQSRPKNLFFLMTKIDKPKQDTMRRQVKTIEAKIGFLMESFQSENSEKEALQPSFLPISAKRPEDIKQFLSRLAQLMPEHPWLFPGDDLTDQPETFVVGELIREQIFRQMGQEIPYSTGVIVKSIRRDLGRKIEVSAAIIVNRKNHKALLIGKGGSRIKELGIKSRESLEKHFDQEVVLELHVFVEENWVDSPDLIASIQRLEPS